ncbi:MAG: DsbA family protein [Actinomycetota bacterium]|nr:DsbA family protein [Actinomycetota bacterium]
MTDLGSAPVPPLQAGDHVRGPATARLIIEYADFECHFCAVTHERLARLSLQRAFRHFPVRSKHPRAWACACAAEAAARQGRFWEFHDALYADQGRIEDPHLWKHARSLGLDVERFDRDRHSDEVAARVRRDFRSGVRAGVVATPTLFVDGKAHAGRAGEIAKLLEQFAG